MVKSMATTDKLGQDLNECLLHKSVLCLYAFVDTSADKFIRKLFLFYNFKLVGIIMKN